MFGNKNNTKTTSKAKEKVEKRVENKKVTPTTKKESHPKAGSVLTKPKKTKKKRPFLSAVIATCANLLGVVALIVLLNMLSSKSLELKNLRNAAIGAEKKSEVKLGDLQIESNIQKSEELQSTFPDEVGLVNFVKEIEKLSSEGSVSNFSFVNQEAVSDRTKSMGFPFVIEFEGTWSEINRDLQKIQKLPFILRAVTIDIRSSKKDDTNLVVFKYGGFIYVSEVFSKN